jgi:hypothetical protein
MTILLLPPADPKSVRVLLCGRGAARRRGVLPRPDVQPKPAAGALFSRLLSGSKLARRSWNRLAAWQPEPSKTYP